MITLTLRSRTILAADIVHFVFEPAHQIQRTAGQYAMVFAPNGESRALSIATAPHEKTIEFITHLTPSPFKVSLGELQPGMTIEITEPIGDFVWPDNIENPLLIAGGVGISPFRSIWRDRLHRKLPMAADLYCYSPKDQFLFVEELATVSQSHPEFLVHRIPNNVHEKGAVKEVETREDRLVLMSGVYSQGKPQDFTQPSYLNALQREEATFMDAARKLIQD